MKEIKVVIWYFYETIWKGTFSEGAVMPHPECIHIAKTLTDRGIINSISSKDDMGAVKAKLESLGLGII